MKTPRKPKGSVSVATADALPSNILRLVLQDFESNPKRYSGELAAELTRITKPKGVAVAIPGAITISSPSGNRKSEIALQEGSCYSGKDFGAGYRFDQGPIKDTGKTPNYSLPTELLERLTSGDENATSPENRGKNLRFVPSHRGETYEDFYDQLQKLRHSVQSEVAQVLEPILNHKVQATPHSEYSEKQELASWVNAQLRELGLAISCPKTSRPAILVADVQGREGGPSRFRLEIRDENGRKVRTFASKDLPELKLMEDASRQEPLATRAQNLRHHR